MIADFEEQEELRCLSKLQASILQIERSVAMLSYCFPLNFEVEVRRCAIALESGRGFRPEFVYRAPAPAFFGAREALDLLGRKAGRARSRWAVVGRLLLDRVEELELEASIVSKRGTSRVSDLSEKRYPFAQGLLDEADALARKWLDEDRGRAKVQRVETHAVSAGLAACAQRECLSVPIAERDIASVCATTDEGILVQRGSRASWQEIERLWLHEAHGHYLPRVRARSLPPPFRAGTRGASEDEEGRALFLEKRFGHLGESRRRSLAMRHLLSRSVATNEAHSQALELVERGCAPQMVAELLCRALRGGGLARERIYLPALLRVEQAFRRSPELEIWLASGRLSLDAAECLQNVGFTAPGGQDWSGPVSGFRQDPADR